MGFVFWDTETTGKGSDRKAPARKPALKRDRKLDALLREALDAASDDSGWADLGIVGSNLVRLASDFDPRSYGFRKLKDLVAAHPDYRIEERSSADGKTTTLHLRSKK